MELNYYTNNQVRRLVDYIRFSLDKTVYPKSLCSLFWWTLLATLALVVKAVVILLGVAALLMLILLLLFPLIQVWAPAPDLGVPIMSFMLWLLVAAAIFDNRHILNDPGSDSILYQPIGGDRKKQTKDTPLLVQWVAAKKSKVCPIVSYDIPFDDDTDWNDG